MFEQYEVLTKKNMDMGIADNIS
uniref:Uncharacterized protein n=1 Tax=Arundo donax TaxID=35708 RepID=A0A0A8ZGV8_ARUDO